MDEAFKRDLKNRVDADSYRVLAEKGTEAPFSGAYNIHSETGNYHCKACGAMLFRHDQKFDSGCGWPSFDEALPGSIREEKDRSHGMIRTEILCAQCGGHLGHVFPDGPTDTGLRYCVNSLSLNFTAVSASDD